MRHVHGTRPPATLPTVNYTPFRSLHTPGSRCRWISLWNSVPRRATMPSMSVSTVSPKWRISFPRPPKSLQKTQLPSTVGTSGASMVSLSTSCQTVAPNSFPNSLGASWRYSTSKGTDPLLTTPRVTARWSESIKCWSNTFGGLLRLSTR